MMPASSGTSSTWEEASIPISKSFASVLNCFRAGLSCPLEMMYTFPTCTTS